MEVNADPSQEALAADLTARALASALGSRPFRAYPALLSTQVDALAWARAGAPSGSVVVADYQASPRGRSGIPWHVRPADDLAFSVIVRPHLAIPREGWLYTLATTALARACGAGATVDWPDVVRRPGAPAAAVGVVAEPGLRALEWAVIDVLVPACPRPRPGLLAAVVRGLEALLEWPVDEVLDEHRARCETLGSRVRAGLLPLGPNAVRVEGAAAATRKDGALVVATDDGRRLAITPQGVGTIEPA